MDLKKGDWDNLEGKVMIYAKFVGDVPPLIPGLQDYARRTPFISVYFSLDVEDFKVKTETSSKEFEALSVVIDKLMPGTKRRIYGGSCLPVSDEDSFLQGDHDVLFIGEYSGADNAFECLKLAGQFYMTRYRDNPANNQEEEKVTYSSLNGDLLGYIVPTFLRPLQRAVDEPGEFAKIRQRFIGFSKDASPRIQTH